MEISRKKIPYEISAELRGYLSDFGRQVDNVPTIYRDLKRFSDAFPYESPDGTETLWQTVVYPPGEMAELRPKLARIYATLKMGGQSRVAEHLDVERIDFGAFGNSRPFRIRIINRFNDNFDHYYVKVADASRIYGLELEHILSPNRINYLVNGDTLIEEHIAGVPGNDFMRTYFDRDDLNRVRVAKEFVKFNERCFIRLLGDMRSVNYVIDVTPDFEEVQYRVRPIDFDQQSYEARRTIYLAQFFKDNLPVVELCSKLLNHETVEQYQKEERTLVRRRYSAAEGQLETLFAAMRGQQLSPPEKQKQLREELAEFHDETSLLACHTMGDLVREHIALVLGKA